MYVSALTQRYVCTQTDGAFGGYSKRGKLCRAGARAKMGTLFWKGPLCVEGSLLGGSLRPHSQANLLSKLERPMAKA